MTEVTPVSLDMEHLRKTGIIFFLNSWDKNLQQKKGKFQVFF